MPGKMQNGKNSHGIPAPLMDRKQKHLDAASAIKEVKIRYDACYSTKQGAHYEQQIQYKISFHSGVTSLLRKSPRQVPPAITQVDE